MLPEPTLNVDPFSVPQPAGKWNPAITSHHTNTSWSVAAYRNTRWRFCRIRGNRVSPVYRLWGSRNAQAGGEAQNER